MSAAILPFNISLAFTIAISANTRTTAFIANFASPLYTVSLAKATFSIGHIVTIKTVNPSSTGIFILVFFSFVLSFLFFLFRLYFFTSNKCCAYK